MTTNHIRTRQMQYQITPEDYTALRACLSARSRQGIVKVPEQRVMAVEQPIRLSGQQGAAFRLSEDVLCLLEETAPRRRLLESVR